MVKMEKKVRRAIKVTLEPMERTVLMAKMV